MGDPKGFLKIQRQDPSRRPIAERVHDWREFTDPLAESVLAQQGARCMDCGVPFCQGDTGCPLHNLIPEWNDLVYRGRWRDALEALHATNNFPEFTGRLCPAPCESACVLGLIERPVSIKNIEEAIIDRGFEEGWVRPQPPARETHRRVAVVGSGPAGLAAAQQLRRLGHTVVVIEQADRVGGLLRYGIPDFKLEKRTLDRRLRQMEAEGVVFRTRTRVGREVAVDELHDEFDAVCLTTGASVARELDVPGRALSGVHLAMDYLEQQNRRVAGERIEPAQEITARNKRVVIIGGGDTGSDCLGTAHRQGALEVHQFELLPMPPHTRHPSTPWPRWPMQLRTSHAHEEGGRRRWSVATTRFSGHKRVERLHGVEVEMLTTDDGRTRIAEREGTEFTMDADLVLLAMGFTGPEPALLDAFTVSRDARGNAATHEGYATSVDGVFAAGDVRRGASLIVWAIREGRECAAAIDAYLASQPAIRLHRPRVRRAG